MEDQQLLALHGLAVKTHGDAKAVAALLDETPERVEQALEAAAAEGLVAGANSTFMVIPAGRQRLEAAYPAWFQEFRANADVQAAAGKFERINADLLALLTDWQSVEVGGETVPNTHEDVDYDQAILDRLGDLHERAAKVIGRLADAQPRLGRYLERLDTAYERALVGEHDFVSGVRVDSYHLVWHELHEDLLRMLGTSREE